MTLNLRRIVIHIVGATALLTVRPAWAGDSAEAEALIRQGVELRAQKKDERALPLFEKAYQISRSPRTAGQLGLVEMALGYFVDAEKYLSEAVASPDHPWVAKNLPTLKAQLATAKSQIGELYIIGEPAGAEVVVNGKSVGRLPLPGPVRLDKGRVDVQVRAAGYVSSSDSVTMVGGKREDRSYRLQREAPVGATIAQPDYFAPGELVTDLRNLAESTRMTSNERGDEEAIVKRLRAQIDALLQRIPDERRETGCDGFELLGAELDRRFEFLAGSLGFRFRFFHLSFSCRKTKGPSASTAAGCAGC